MPPSTLEILTIQLCDDGALIDTSISPFNDPDMMVIREVRRPKAIRLSGLEWVPESMVVR